MKKRRISWIVKLISFKVVLYFSLFSLSIFLINSCSSSTDYKEPSINNYQGGEVKIDSQIWMNQNLNVNVFRNGDPIPEAKTNEEWEKAAKNKQPAWCYYKNDSKNGTKYGKLYNWYAVNDKRGLAPAGWHIPTNAEWTKLTDFLGGQSVAGTKMKSASGWNSYETDNTCSNCRDWNEEYRKKVPCHECKDNRVIGSKETIPGNGTNSSGFSGLPGGYRDYYGFFHFIGYYGYWWSASEYSSSNAYNRSLNYVNGKLFRDDNYKGKGLYVRCLRD